MEKKYLGNGVYVERVYEEMVLTVEQNDRTTTTIFLNERALKNFFDYVKKDNHFSNICNFDPTK